MKTNHLLGGALCTVSLFAVAASAYGIRTRNIAIEGWQAWASVNAEKEAALKEVEVLMNGDARAGTPAREFQKLTVLRDAGLPVSSSIDPREANEAVRDFVYRTNKVGVGTFAFRRGDQRYAMLGQNAGAQLCHGMALAQEWALSQIGVPSRAVVLAGENFLSGKDRFETHAVNEVWLDGKWQISDPTFNISVDCSDGKKNLSVPEAAACVRAGGKLVPVPGKTQIVGKGRTVAEYYAPYETFFAAYERDPVDIANITAPKEEYPEPNWIRKSLQLYPETAKSATVGQ